MSHLAITKQPVEVREIRVLSGRIVCSVAIANKQHRTTTPRLADAMLHAMPTLAQHVCVNSRGSVFGACINHTPLPHLIEHVAIDIQTRNTNMPTHTFVGTSEWINEDAGTARIQLSFKDDLQALRAFSEATNLVNKAVLTCYV